MLPNLMPASLIPASPGTTLALVAQAANNAEQGTSASLRLVDVPALWVLVLIVVPLLAAIAWGGYMFGGGRVAMPPAARWLLGGLRFGALAILALILMRPVEVEQREDVFPAEVLVLLDDSASMQRKDAYGGDQDMRTALSELTSSRPEDAMRLELVQQALEGGFLADLGKKGYEVELYSFAERLAGIESTDDLTGRGRATHLGDALTRALTGARGRHLTDVLVLSDGRSNGGLPVLDAGRAASALGVPVHTVVVGDTRPVRNARIELVEVPPSALEGDEIEVALRVVGRGTPDDATGMILLEELDPRSPSDVGRPIAEESVRLTEAGERTTLIAPPVPTDGQLTERRFRVSLPPIEGETLTDDNTLEFSVHVSPLKVRVLYVDGYPRWEYRYLKNLLLRADANFQVQCYLLSATADFRQESSPDLPSLRAVPTSRDALLADYDVVILGDVAPYAISPDPELARQFLAALRGFVESGGGLFFQAGEFDNPRSYRGTPLEELMPVLLPTSGVGMFDVDTTLEVRPELEEPGAPHEIVRLTSDLDLNQRLWEDEDGLRGFYWFQPVLRAKPGSQVLLRHPSMENNHGRLPLFVSGYFPEGRTLFLAIDSTWMWRYHFGDRYHERFWRNSIRWLALGRLKSGDRRHRLETARSSYDLDERVPLEARVLDEDFRPSDSPSQEILLAGPSGSPESVVLPAVPGRQGLFRGAVDVERPGLYRAWIEIDGRAISTAEFEVVLPSRENAEPAPDPQTLASLASMTNGRAVSLAALDSLRDEFPGEEERREQISSRLEDAWDRWLSMIVALSLLSLEWVLRKRYELV